MSEKNLYYDKISQLKEAEDFMRVMKKWDVLSHRLSAEGQVPMFLPDLLWVAKSGVGKTNLLRLLGEYLYAGNLMEFHGNVKYFEFMLDYCPPGGNFTEIQRLINEVSNAAGFRNLYKGIISIDIEEWLGHCDEKHFVSFLEYLSSNSDDWLIIFNVTGEQEGEIERLESVLSMYFRLEKAVLALPATEQLLSFVVERLGKYNLTVAEDAKEVIYHVIEKLRTNKFFDGYKTLLILCQDIAYEMYTDEASGSVVTAAQLKHFGPNSQYIRRVTRKSENKRKIGLINWEEN